MWQVDDNIIATCSLTCSMPTCSSTSWFPLLLFQGANSKLFFLFIVNICSETEYVRVLFVSVDLCDFRHMCEFVCGA